MKKLLALALLGAAGQFAYAHTELAESTPADHAALESAPKEITLHFSEPVRLTSLSVQKHGGAQGDLGPLPSAAGRDFALAAPTGMSTGMYTVSWRALSEDTHVMTGQFGFTIGMAAAHSEGPAAQAPHKDHSSH